MLQRLAEDLVYHISWCGGVRGRWHSAFIFDRGDVGRVNSGHGLCLPGPAGGDGQKGIKNEDGINPSGRLIPFAPVPPDMDRDGSLKLPGGGEDFACE